MLRRDTSTAGDVRQVRSSATRQSSINYGRTHLLNPYFDTEWLWRKDSLNTFTFEIQAEHKRKRDLQRIDDEQSESSASSPSIYAATLLQQSRTEGSGRTATLYGRASWEHYVKDGALGASAEFDFEDGNSETYTTRNIERVKSESGHAAVKSEKSESMRQYAFSPLNSLKLKAEAHFQHWVTKQWLLDLSYWLNYERRRTHQDFETNGTTDAATHCSLRMATPCHGFLPNLSSTPSNASPSLSTPANGRHRSLV